MSETISTKLSTQTIIARLFQLALALIPALEGIFAFLNNTRGMNDTLTHMIQPLLTMQSVSPEFMNSWRAIHSEFLIHLAYFFIMSCETTVGILGTIGVIKMLKNFFADHDRFNLSQAWVRAACVLGFLVWGLGFYTIAGDYFLAWQNPNLGVLQTSGLNYVLMMAIPYFFFKLHEVSSTI